MSIELPNMKPCPFCGSEVNVNCSFYPQFEGTKAPFCMVSCECGATGRIIYMHEEIGVYEAKKEAILHWNMRNGSIEEVELEI